MPPMLSLHLPVAGQIRLPRFLLPTQQSGSIRYPLMIMATTRRASVAILAVLLISGCTTGPRLATTSGRPEVTIPRTTAQRVRAVIIERGMASGWILERETENTIIFLHLTQNALAGVLLASSYDTTVKERIRYTVVPVGNDIKLYTSVEFVTNQGSAFERATPITNNNYYRVIQQNLEQIKAQALEKR